MKIEKDKSKMECLANSGGFILGIAIDENKNVFACEMKEAAVYKYDSSRKTFTEFAKGLKSQITLLLIVKEIVFMYPIVLDLMKKE